MGFNVATVKCAHCKRIWVSVWPDSCVPDWLECPSCHCIGADTVPLEIEAFRAISKIAENSDRMERLLKRKPTDPLRW